MYALMILLKCGTYLVFIINFFYHFYLRDKTGNEIDLIVDMGKKLLPIEIKTSRTYSPVFKQNINKWLSLPGNTNKEGIIIYRGNDIIEKNNNIPTVPWYIF